MKKLTKILYLILTVGLALSLGACGSDQIGIDPGISSCLKAVENCLDENQNGICDDEEAISITSDDGGTDTGNPENSDGGTDTGNPENTDDGGSDTGNPCQ